jgi:hypothetical protein
MKKLLVLCLLAGLTALTSTSYSKAADDAPAPAPADKTEKKTPSNRHVPFHGKVDVLDKTAGTLKIGERTFHVTSATKITKAGKPSSIEAAAVGEEVGGAYQLRDGGRLEVTSLRIGPKPAKPAKEEESKP